MSRDQYRVISKDQYFAIAWCRDMAAQDHRSPETVERLSLASDALWELRPRSMKEQDAELLEKRVERLEQTVRAHAVVSDARWARRSVTRSVPGRVSFTVLEKTTK